MRTQIKFRSGHASLQRQAATHQKATTYEPGKEAHGFDHGLGDLLHEILQGTGKVASKGEKGVITLKDSDATIEIQASSFPHRNNLHIINLTALRDGSRIEPASESRNREEVLHKTTDFLIPWIRRELKPRELKKSQPARIRPALVGGPELSQ